MSRVKLEVFNIAGEIVVTLANNNFIPGNHKINWQAKDFPSGIYFCKMTVGDEAMIRRLILMK